MVAAPKPPSARIKRAFSSSCAVVTGANAGMGLALTQRIIQCGGRVLGLDLKTSSLDPLKACHPETLTLAQVDVADGAALDAAVAAHAARHGSLDHAFNNAGIVVGGDFLHTDDDALRRIVDVNLWGVIHGTRAAYRLMAQQGHGAIINTASTAGFMGVPYSAAYSATKHAVVGLSHSLREEARQRGVRVHLVVPGLIDTGIFDTAINAAGYNYRAAMDAVPLPKLSPSAAADATLEGVARGTDDIVFPRINRGILAAHRMFPGLMRRLTGGQTQAPNQSTRQEEPPC